MILPAARCRSGQTLFKFFSPQPFFMHLLRKVCCTIFIQSVRGQSGHRFGGKTHRLIHSRRGSSPHIVCISGYLLPFPQWRALPCCSKFPAQLRPVSWDSSRKDMPRREKPAGHVCIRCWPLLVLPHYRAEQLLEPATAAAGF
jgi:hypothetical protein